MEAFYFLNVFKPKNITSFDVIYKLRKLLNIRQIGHSGTLDPMAEGVMQVGVGKATKLLDYLSSDKEYIAKIKFGYTSSTLDMEGEITKVPFFDFSEEDLIEVLKTFSGKITQIPPKFSAIKVGGKKLCDIARKTPNMQIEIPKRDVEIYNIELLNFKKDKNQATAIIKVSCSKGTYIRTLASDIAKKLNTDSYLTGLTRTKAGNFKIENSIKIEESPNKENQILPQDALSLEKIPLTEKQFNLVKNGVAIYTEFAPKNSPCILTYQNKLVSIGIFIDNKIKVKKFFNPY